MGLRKAKANGIHFGRTQHLARRQAPSSRTDVAQGVLIKTLMQDYYLSQRVSIRYLSPSDGPSRSDSTPFSA